MSEAPLSNECRPYATSFEWQSPTSSHFASHSWWVTNGIHPSHQYYRDPSLPSMMPMISRLQYECLTVSLSATHHPMGERKTGTQVLSSTLTTSRCGWSSFTFHADRGDRKKGEPLLVLIHRLGCGRVYVYSGSRSLFRPWTTCSEFERLISNSQRGN